MAFDTPNTLPQNLGSLIDTNTSIVSGTTPDGYVPTDYEQQSIDAYNQQFAPAEIGPQGQDSLYPGLGHNINVGTQSGQIIGSQGIYVPGGNIMALDPVLARRKAIDDAAKARALEISKPFEYQKPKAFKDARFQQKFNQDVYGFQDSIVSEAKSKYGPNWRAMLKDQSTELGGKLIQGMANYEAIVNNTDQITALVADIDEGLKDNSIYLSPEKRKAYNEYKGMLNDFGDYDKLSKSDFETLHATLLGERDLNNYFNKEGILQSLEAKINEYSNETDEGTTYVTRSGKTTDYTGIKKDLAKQLKETTFANSSYTEQDIYDNLDARLKNQKSITKSITEKSEGAVGRNEAEQINAWDSKNQYAKGQEKFIKGTSYNPEGKRTGTFDLKGWADYNINLTSDKTIDVNERDEKGNIRTKKIKGIPLDGVEVLNPDGSIKVIPGKTYASVGTVRTIVDPKDKNKYLIVAETDIEVPTKREDFEEGVADVKGGDTYSTQKSYIVLSRNGVGTGTKSKIETNIKNSKKRDLFNDGFNELNKVGKERTGETKPSTDNNVEQQYEVNGQGWTADELKASGWSDLQIRALKKK